MAVKYRNVGGSGREGAAWRIGKWDGRWGGVIGINMMRGLADYGPTVVETVAWHYKGYGDRGFTRTLSHTHTLRQSHMNACTPFCGPSKAGIQRSRQRAGYIQQGSRRVFPTLCSSSKLLTEIEPTSVVKEKVTARYYLIYSSKFILLFLLFPSIHHLIYLMSQWWCLSPTHIRKREKTVLVSCIFKYKTYSSWVFISMEFC